MYFAGKYTVASIVPKAFDDQTVWLARDGFHGCVSGMFPHLVWQYDFSSIIILLSKYINTVCQICNVVTTYVIVMVQLDDRSRERQDQYVAV